jgi:hypothetical protein
MDSEARLSVRPAPGRELFIELEPDSRKRSFTLADARVQGKLQVTGGGAIGRLWFCHRLIGETEEKAGPPGLVAWIQLLWGELERIGHRVRLTVLR